MPAPKAERSVLEQLGVLGGGTLVLVGLGLTAAQLFDLQIPILGWPLLVTIPGILLLLVAYSVPRGRGVSYLAVPGTIVAATGAVLALQAASGDWRSWAYAWPLIIPGSAGAGLLLAGARERSRPARTAGAVLIATGGLLFAFSEWLFVRVLHLGGPGLGWAFGLVMPGIFVVAGVAVIIAGLRRAR